jgi:hypothetical protein
MTDLRPAPPKLFEHVCRVFGEMKNNAIAVNLQDGDGTRHAFVWEGHTTRLFRALELPSPYYTSVLGRLETMGCIAQLSRGGGTAVSRWELLDDPELEPFMNAESASKGRKGRKTKLQQHDQMLLDLSKRLADIETRLGMQEAS